MKSQDWKGFRLPVRQTAIDLFSGSGAVSEALTQGNFTVLAAVDNDPTACGTYGLNHGADKVVEGDIRKLPPKLLRGLVGIEPRIDLLTVCAPCQPFSNQNRHRSADDPRASLILESLKFIREFSPRLVWFENVPGLASQNEILERLRMELTQIGYYLSCPRRIDAADLGVPQRRVRCVMVASTSRSAVNLFEQERFVREPSTVRHAIGHLRPLSSGESDPEDPLHFARRHHPVTLKRLQAIPKNGGSRNSLPTKLQLRCHRDLDERSFPDVYGRMSWDDVAPTLTTGCVDVTRGRFAHPEQNRAITLREAALLQTFPTRYGFSGSIRQMQSQIGNAVPVRMVEGLIPTFLRAIELVLSES